MSSLLVRAMPGLVMVQPQGNLLEILVGYIAAYIVARLFISLRFLDIPLRAQSRRQLAQAP